MFLTGGCSVTNNSSDDCEPRTLDLREPPLTREAIGMPEGESVSTWRCDDGFDLKILFPDEISLEVTAEELGTDSHRAEDWETGDPTTIDVYSMFLSIDEAGDLASSIADTLGIDPSPVEAWREDARNPPDDTLDTKTRFIRGSVGHVDAELQVIHQSVSGNNNVHLILYLRR